MDLSSTFNWLDRRDDFTLCQGNFISNYCKFVIQDQLSLLEYAQHPYLVKRRKIGSSFPAAC